MTDKKANNDKFNFKLGNTGGQAQVAKSNDKGSFERLTVKIESYDLPANGFHQAKGINMLTGEKVSVRLNTVKEGIDDHPKMPDGKIAQLYTEGENTRQSITDIAARGKAPVVVFDKAVELSSNGDGVNYRAHWANAFGIDHDAEVKPVLGSIHIRPEARGANNALIKAKTEIHVIEGSDVLNESNIEEFLASSLDNKDEAGRPRRGFASLAVEYDGKALPNLSDMRIYPHREEQMLLDQNTGEEKKIFLAADVDVTLSNIAEGVSRNNAKADHNDNLLRTIHAALVNDKPNFVAVSQDEQENAKAVEYYNNIYEGIVSGELEVVGTQVDVIPFGVKAAKNMQKDANQPQYRAYNQSIVFPKSEDDKVYPARKFTDTVIAISRHDDGAPFATSALPAKQYSLDTMVDFTNARKNAPGFSFGNQMSNEQTIDNTKKQDEPSLAM